MLNSLARACSAFFWLIAIVFCIPLAFDVGGRHCGLGFSLALFLFYGTHALVRVATPTRSRFRKTLGHVIGTLQWPIIPGLLIWSLAKFSVDSGSSSWVEKAFKRERARDEALGTWLFGTNGLVENMSIGAWDKILRWSVPVCQLAEGFCSLLVIQAAGQMTKWAVNTESGDNWMIGLLVMSASIISSSVYFLYRITTFPEIDNLDAIFIGAAVTCAIFLCAWGIGSGRGNPVESSLLFAYVTLCIYQIFTNYQPDVLAQPMTPPSQPEFPPLPPIIMASYSTLMHMFSSLPTNLHSAFNFLFAAIMTITPSVIISLAYRVFVMFASTRIIPAVRESGARALSQEPSLDDDDGIGQILGFASYFSKSILITVYTSLLMQHFAASGGTGGPGQWWTSQGGDAGGNVWRWANLGITMLLYAIELRLGKGDNDTLTSHWKID